MLRTLQCTTLAALLWVPALAGLAPAQLPNQPSKNAQALEKGMKQMFTRRGAKVQIRIVGHAFKNPSGMRRSKHTSAKPRTLRDERQARRKAKPPQQKRPKPSCGKQTDRKRGNPRSGRKARRTRRPTKAGRANPLKDRRGLRSAPDGEDEQPFKHRLRGAKKLRSTLDRRPPGYKTPDEDEDPVIRRAVRVRKQLARMPIIRRQD